MKLNIIDYKTEYMEWLEYEADYQGCGRLRKGEVCVSWSYWRSFERYDSDLGRGGKAKEFAKIPV